MATGSTRVLYLSYTGVMEPLGQSQVLSYLKRLADQHQISLISYEKPEDLGDEERRAALESQIATAGIRWYPLRYHRRLSIVATSYDVLAGLVLSRQIVRDRRIQVVHARSYVASMIALHLKRRLGIPFVFDMRGFWADEKVDSGTWSRGSPLFRLAKRYEREFLESSDAVVSLTHAGVRAIEGLGYLQGRDTIFEVIPTCADLERFTPPVSKRSGPFMLGYVGNTTGWYRFDPVLTAFEAIRDRHPDARLSIVNQGQHEAIRARLSARGVPPGSVEVIGLDFQDVPDAIRRMDATAFFIEPTFSKKGSAPTKLAEFLGCGVPCLVNDGVGDVGPIVRNDGVGIVVNELADAAVTEGALRLLDMASDPATRARCVRSASRRFSLDAGVAAYDSIYRRLVPGPVT